MREPAPVADKTDKTPNADSPGGHREVLLSIAGASILLLATAAIIAFLGLRTGRQSSAGPSTPSGTVQATATSLTSPLPTPGCEPIIDSGGVEVSVAPPVSAVVGDSSFTVEPFVPGTHAWSYPSDRSEVAVWICGTVVNYVMGLEPSAETTELMASLAPGDSLRLQLANGTVLAFRFAGRQDVEPGDESILVQQRPLLTLLLAEDDRWHIATADYVTAEVSSALAVSEPSVQPGQATLAGGARVVVNRGYTRRTDDLPPGTAYYLVEFSVENLSGLPMAANSFSMRLQDALGNTYLVSPAARDAVGYDRLQGEMSPGASVQSTVGYLVPDPLPAGSVVWAFSPHPGSGEEVRVNIPYDGGEGSVSPGASAEVTITDAFLNTKGDVLIILGEIRNGVTEPLTVEPPDVTLSSNAGAGELIAAAPPLPWSIQPGQTQVIELQYQTPSASSALLELLGYSFEIGGLQ